MIFFIGDQISSAISLNYHVYYWEADSKDLILNWNVRDPKSTADASYWSDIAPLHSAQLHSAQLHSAQLHSAQLHSAQLHSAQLHSAQLHSAQLHSAQLHSAQLQIVQTRFTCPWKREQKQIVREHFSEVHAQLHIIFMLVYAYSNFWSTN